MHIKGSNVSVQCGHYPRQVAMASVSTRHSFELEHLIRINYLVIFSFINKVSSCFLCIVL